MWVNTPEEAARDKARYLVAVVGLPGMECEELVIDTVQVFTSTASFSMDCIAPDATPSGDMPVPLSGRLERTLLGWRVTAVHFCPRCNTQGPDGQANF